jgi:hypothetical protein
MIGKVEAVGKPQNFEFSHEKVIVFDESWYRHPDTGKVMYRWTASMEFVGRNLEDV